MSQTVLADDEPERPSWAVKRASPAVTSSPSTLNAVPSGTCTSAVVQRVVERARVVRHAAAAQAVREAHQPEPGPGLDRRPPRARRRSGRPPARRAGAEGARRRHRDLPGLAGEQLAAVALHEAGERLRGRPRPPRRPPRTRAARAGAFHERARSAAGAGQPRARHVHERALAVHPAELERAEPRAAHGQPAGGRALLGQPQPAREVVRRPAGHHRQRDARPPRPPPPPARCCRRRPRRPRGRAPDATALADLLDVEAPHLRAERAQALRAQRRDRSIPSARLPPAPPSSPPAARLSCVFPDAPVPAMLLDPMGAQARVFVTRQLPGDALERLQAEHDVEVWPERLPPPREELLARAPELEGLLSLLTDPVDAELIEAAPRLRAISNYAVGVDNVDVEAATARGIPVGNTPGRAHRVDGRPRARADARHRAAAGRGRGVRAGGGVGHLGAGPDARSRPARRHRGDRRLRPHRAGGRPPARGLRLQAAHHQPERRGAARGAARALRLRDAALPAHAGDARPDRRGGAARG